MNSKPKYRPGSAGFSLVEIAVVTLLLLIAIGSLSSAVISSITLSRSNEETAIADDAARQQLARLRTVPFTQIHANFVANPNFDVPQLATRVGDPDDLVGQILFPTWTGFPTELRERADTNVRGLGYQEDAFGILARDLNGDGVTDDLDHSVDYLVLPVTIRLEWRGPSGLRWTELHALLTE